MILEFELTIFLWCGNPIISLTPSFFIRKCDSCVGVVGILIFHKKFQDQVFCIVLNHCSIMEVLVLTEFTACIDEGRNNDWHKLLLIICSLAVFLLCKFSFLFRFLFFVLFFLLWYLHSATWALCYLKLVCLTKGQDMWIVSFSAEA